LQVLNHLQDCAEDYRNLDRVYLPLEMMAEAGIAVSALSAPAANQGLRQVIDRLLDATDRLIAAARLLPGGVAARGLRWESATIVDLARRLSRRLRRGDPLASRIALSKGDFAAALLTGIVRGRRR
jgi:phytoene/squalene synthetase